MNLFVSCGMKSRSQSALSFWTEKLLESSLRSAVSFDTSRPRIWLATLPCDQFRCQREDVRTSAVQQEACTLQAPLRKAAARRTSDGAVVEGASLVSALSLGDGRYIVLL